MRRHRRRAVAKISDLHKAIAVEEQVAGLYVAVNGVLRLVQVPARAISKNVSSSEIMSSITKGR